MFFIRFHKTKVRQLKQSINYFDLLQNQLSVIRFMVPTRWRTRKMKSPSSSRPKKLSADKRAGTSPVDKFAALLAPCVNAGEYSYYARNQKSSGRFIRYGG